MPTAILLEVCFTARDPAEWDARIAAFSVFPPVTPTTATHEIAMSIQGKLWRGGKVRAAGAVDTLVAALAIARRHGGSLRRRLRAHRLGGPEAVARVGRAARDPVSL